MQQREEHHAALGRRVVLRRGTGIFVGALLPLPAVDEASAPPALFDSVLVFVVFVASLRGGLPQRKMLALSPVSILFSLPSSIPMLCTESVHAAAFPYRSRQTMERRSTGKKKMRVNPFKTFPTLATTRPTRTRKISQQNISDWPKPPKAIRTSNQRQGGGARWQCGGSTLRTTRIRE